MNYSSESERDFISIDFLNFFKSYFKDQKFDEEKEFNLRFYVFLLHSYIDYCKIPSKELISSWDNEIKPFIFKKYSFEQSGIFNINADIKYIIKEIDTLIKKSRYITMNKNILEKRNKITKIPSNENLQEINNISPLSNSSINFDQEQDEFENDLEIMKIEDEEELMNKGNMIDFKNKDKNKNDNNDDFAKRTVSMNDLKMHSLTIASKSRAVSIYDELNNKADDVRSSICTETNTMLKVKEIKPNYSDEFETEGVTIVHRKNSIIHISFNLFLKKIIVGNFFDEFFDYTINFTEQCFFFMKRDIVFKKIINCYNYYTDLKVPFVQRKKLIHFMNVLVIKMYECFDKIEDKEEVLSIIKKFYNNLINELKPIVAKSKKISSKLQDFFFGGINAIKTGYNNINKTIKDKIEKNSGGNDNQKKEDNTNNIKGNLNIILVKRKQIKEVQEKSKINDNKIEDLKNDNKKEKEKGNEKEMLPEEEVMIECEKILALFKSDTPKQDILNHTEQALKFYKLKIIYQNNKNDNNNNPSRNIRKLKKSNTERYLTFSVFDEDKKKEINIKKPYFSCLNYEIKDIGEELIYVTQSALNKIKRKELYNGAFLKKSKLIASPNIVENINKFNNLIFFIIQDILSYDFPKDRAKIIERWANIADYCKKRKDYNDIFAINSVFKNFIIIGLDLTWREVGNKTKKIIRDLDNFCSFEGNYKNVREDLKLLNKNEFYTPYLGLLLKDLNYYEENSKYLVNGNLINFEKINDVQNSIDNFFHFQKIKDKKIVNLLSDLEFFENLESQKENDLEALANKLEPKFLVYINPKKAKRLTYIDKKYFRSHSGKGFLSNSMRQGVE